MSKERKMELFSQLNSNMKKYNENYEGFRTRSLKIEENEYRNQFREEMKLEVLNQYGAL